MKNKFYILFFIVLISGIFSCKQNNSTEEKSGPALFPKPQTYPLNINEGYKINPVTGDSIKPLINSLGDTIKTGVKIPAIGKRISVDSVSEPTVVKAGKGVLINSFYNIHAVSDDLRMVYVDENKLNKTLIPEIKLGDTSHYIINSAGKKVPSGIKIPARGRKVKTSRPKSTPALLPRMKENALCDIQYLDIDQGMNSSYVFCALEDKRGNLWFGTDAGGVSFYDGESFLHFGKKEGLSNTTVWSMLEDRKGNLWFSTIGGVFVFDGNSFTHYGEREGLSNNLIRTMIEDKYGNIWLGTRGGGVTLFDGKYFTHYGVKEGLSGNLVWAIMEDSHGNIWLGTNNGASKLVMKSDGSGPKEFVRYQVEDGLIHNGVWSILEDNDGNIWFGTNGGVCRLEKVNKSKNSWFIHYDIKNGLANNAVRHIIKDKNGKLWIATQGGGISFFDGRSFINYSKNEGLSNDYVWYIMEGRNGDLWICTYGGGVNIFNNKSYTHFSESVGISNNYVRSILEDSKGNFWFGTKGGGANYYDGKSFVHYGTDQGLSNNYIMSIIEDHNGNIWFGTDGGGVSKFDGKSFTQYGIKEGLSSNYIKVIHEDKKGNIWIGSDLGGIIVYDGEYFTHYGEQEGLSNPTIRSIMEDSNGNLWFGTYGGGVIFYDGKSFIHYSEKEGLSNNTIWSIFEDSNGGIWFGTYDGGVNYFNDSSFVYIGQNEGMCNNTIWGIMEDTSGNIWFSTEKGISEIAFMSNEHDKGVTTIQKKSGKTKDKLNEKSILKREFKIRNLVVQDGMKGIDFYTNSSILDSKNRAWLGSGKGLTMLDLNKFKYSNDIPSPVLRQIDINETFIDFRNISDSLREEIEFTDVQRFENYPLNLELPYDMNHLTFHFAAIDWYAPHKIKYQYKMEGLQKNWSEVTNETKADFRNLPYGTYTFKVRAIGESQIWSKPFEYTFTIHPPWWHTTWFRVCYVSCFGLLLYLLFRWRTKSLRDRQKQLEKTVEERTADVVAEKKVVEEQKHLVEEKQKEIIDSINYAQRLQQAILATKEDIDRNIPENFLLYIPKDIVAGDFYFFEVTDEFIFYAAADCTGHGVPGAMVSIVCSNALTRCVKEFDLTDPGKILDKTRELILETFKKSTQDVKDGMDISFISINKKTNEIKWAGANNPLWYIENGEMKEIKADKQPIGKTDHPKPFTSYSLPLSLSSLFLFTDGYADQFGGERGKKFKYSNLQKLLLENANSKPELIKAKLESVFSQWKGDLEQVDDVCIIGIRI